jgi:hypothetical protein
MEIWTETEWEREKKEEIIYEMSNKKM